MKGLAAIESSIDDLHFGSSKYVLTCDRKRHLWLVATVFLVQSEHTHLHSGLDGTCHLELCARHIRRRAAFWRRLQLLALPP